MSKGGVPYGNDLRRHPLKGTAESTVEFDGLIASDSSFVGRWRRLTPPADSNKLVDGKRKLC